MRKVIQYNLVFVTLVVPHLLSCGTKEDQPIDKWIGAWQYLENREGKLVPSIRYAGARKILFSPDGTWEHSLDDDNGVYIVFENRFTITRGGYSSREGSWTRDGNILN